MIDLIANADPLAWPVFAVWLFAASMYPLGLMIGAPCSTCCEKCPSNTIRCGSLCCETCCDGACCGPGEFCVDGKCQGPCLRNDLCEILHQVISPIPTDILPRRPDLCGGVPTFSITREQQLFDGDDCGFFRGAKSDELYIQGFENVFLNIFADVRWIRDIYSRPSDSGLFYVRLVLRVYVYSEPLAVPEPTIDAQVAFTASVQSSVPLEGRDDDTLYLRTSIATVTLSNGCIATRSRRCSFSGLTRTPDWTLPRVISVTPDSTGLDVEWTTTESFFTSVNRPQIENFVDTCLQTYISEVPPLTVRFERGTSCATLECDQVVDWNKLYVEFDDLPGLKYPLGQIGPVPGSPCDPQFFNCQYSIGDLGAGRSIVFDRMDNSNGRILERKVVVLFLEFDENVGELRWYAAYSSACYGYEIIGLTERAHINENRWIGFLVCSPLCDPNAENNLGNSVPLGRPLEVEQVPGYPQTTMCFGGDCDCEPPGRIGFVIGQVGAC